MVPPADRPYCANCWLSKGATFCTKCKLTPQFAGKIWLCGLGCLLASVIYLLTPPGVFEYPPWWELDWELVVFSTTLAISLMVAITPRLYTWDRTICNADRFIKQAQSRLGTYTVDGEVDYDSLLPISEESSTTIIIRPRKLDDVDSE